MFIELYVLMQVLCVFILFGAFIKRNPLLWAFGGMLAAVLAISSFGMQERICGNNYAITNTTNTTFKTVTSIHCFTDTTSEPAFFGVNLGLFFFGVVMFFVDLFATTDYAQVRRKD